MTGIYVERMSCFIFALFIIYIQIIFADNVSHHVKKADNEHLTNSTVMGTYRRRFNISQKQLLRNHSDYRTQSFRQGAPSLKNNGKLSCDLQPYDESVEFFSKEVLKNKYNFMYLKLHFYNQSNISEEKHVINGFDWVWTFKGETGAHQYLYLPGDFGYLSFGLLWAHTRIESMDINIKTIGNCSNLSIGEKGTNYLIGEALGVMTSKIASIDDRYNSSYWCFNHRLWIESDSLYWLCRNSICTVQTFEYRCCKYVIHMNLTRTVLCTKGNKHFGALWWMLPIIVGVLLFAFHPIALVKLVMNFTQWSETAKQRSILPTKFTSFVRASYRRHVDRKLNYISLKDGVPISFMSTIFSPISNWECSGPISSRLRRLWFIVVPVTICTIRVSLDYIYAGDLVKGAVDKGALVGFSSLIAGPEAARKVFLRCFDGPITALGMFLAFSFSLILCPTYFDMFLEKGLLGSDTSQHLLLLKLPTKQIERFSGISIRKTSGYKRFYALSIGQSFMLLHWKFWRHAIKYLCTRWTYLIHSVIILESRSHICKVLAHVVFLPPYVLFSTLELAFTVLYFMFPVINSIFLVLKATLVGYIALFNNRGCFLKLVRIVLILPLIVLVLFSWYMYCIIFFDAFWFLSKIAMFTYAGVIAYPKLSYGYMILSLMSVYYLMESARAFGESYRELLKTSIEVAVKITDDYLDNEEAGPAISNIIVYKHSLNRDLFLLIVDRHRPQRNQVVITMLKFMSIITVLAISVELLVTFDKIQDLSLVSHVFTVLFVCALPKLVRIVCMQRYKTNAKRRLKSKIKKTMECYLRHNQTGYCSDEFTSVHNGYGAINDIESNEEDIVDSND